MAADQFASNHLAHLDRLLQFLSQDPDNLNLLADAATVALEAHRFSICDELLARHQAIRPLPPRLVNMQGVSAMSQGRFAEALGHFHTLSESRADAVLSYNTAYASAMCGSYEPAASLDAPCLDAVSGAGTLKLRALHYLGRLDEALQLGQRLAGRPDAPAEFNGAYATLLFDLDDQEGAQRYARQSVETPDGLTVLGLAALEAGDTEQAFTLLRKALARNPREARATLGLGLCLFAEERFAEAATTLDQAAEQLATHLGAWIAAGWARLLLGDVATARTRFHHASTLDRGFAEAHGALAVVSHLEGLHDDARRHAETALRLDPTCLSGALAKSMQHENAGQAGAASAIRNAALHQPLGTGGRTIAQSLKLLGLKRK
ncbi:tetratricopeptide repeat protein [Burkholderia stagnalis]|uniref:tetratricopeptide repeat protein n=1 Tax=Burkholderia stagnalis TaxID=1503054 RepID=UPI000F5FCE30|nr:tetratricopeptide repeat protein [Burkholderia stagnalis]RQX94976.1 hypothetical protein DF119_22580 [Burkholderia stagnalis]RQY32528.1 hypothetical protein DF116_26835 [Burkholderia stagnalis]RQY56600.1 hypothetical protein DF111_12380 [Burkholderia stagnalis]RQY86374.1 hypothetical protein DF108_12195 [Burkholderia stagnalis]